MWSPITDVARVLIRHTHEDTDLHGFTGGFAGEWVEACNGALVGGCCAALASLSFEPEARAQLQEAGALGAVLEICLTCQSNLTSVAETITTRRCATTLCNISSDNNETRRCQLVEQGIVNALARLSESYSEDMQNDIARCLCNLACAADAPQKMVEQGAVQILMMISMMRAVAVPTRRCCAQAFWNICTPPTLTYLLEAAIDAREREARRASAAADDAKKRKEPAGGGLRALQPNMGFVHAFALLAAQDDEPTLAPGQEKRAKFPTSKALISADFHSFRLIFGRAIISRNGLEAWMLFLERARAEHSC